MVLLAGINPGFILIALGLIACFIPVQRVRNIMTVGAPSAGLSGMTGYMRASRRFLQALPWLRCLAVIGSVSSSFGKSGRFQRRF